MVTQASKQTPTRRCPIPTATAPDTQRTSPFTPRKDVDRAFRALRRKTELRQVNEDLINFQLERLVSLRAREIESGKEMTAINGIVRTIEPLLKRREAFEREDAAKPPAADDDHGWSVSMEQFRNIVRIYARRAIEDPDADETADEAALRRSFEEVLGPSVIDEIHALKSVPPEPPPTPPATPEPAGAALDIAPSVADETDKPAPEPEDVEENAPPAFIPDPHSDYIRDLRYRKAQKTPTIDLAAVLGRASRDRPLT